MTCRYRVVRRRVGSLLAGAAIVLAIAGCSSRQADSGPAKFVTSDAPIDPVVVDLLRKRATREPTTLPAPQIVEDGVRATLIYSARNAQPQVLREAVEGLVSPEGSVQESASLNVIVVTDRSELIPPMLKVLEGLDRPVAQLLVEARVIEVTLDSDLEYEIRHALSVAGASSFLQSSGITLGTPGGSPLGDQGSLVNIRSWSNDGNVLDTFVRLLMTRGQARLLSSPNLIVGPGTDASIITGEEVPVLSSTVAGGSIQTTTTFKRVGIKLRVNLLQITNDTARVEINPEVSAVTGYTAATQNNPANPIIAIRNVTSTLSLKDGEILTVGGLLRSEERKLTRGVPLLQDIPLLGVLFRSQRNQTVKTQLVFFLRTSILDEGEVGQARVHRPGAGLEVLDRLVDGPATQPADLRNAQPTTDTAEDGR